MWRGCVSRIQFLKEQGHTVVIAEHRLYFSGGSHRPGLLLPAGQAGANLQRRGIPDFVPGAESGAGAAQPDAFASGPAAGQRRGDLQVEGLTCGYGRAEPVLSELSFGASRGEVLAVTGCNGRGKDHFDPLSLRPDEGTRRKDPPLPEESAGRSSGGRKAFWSCRTSTISCSMTASSTSAGRRQEKRSPEIDSVLARFDLQGYRERYPMALSGGQKQRLAVATALLSGRRLLIFDEPTSGLDYGNMMQVSGVVRDLAAQGHIVLVVSHDREFMESGL